MITHGLIILLKARNYAISKASNKYIIMIDSDEIIISIYKAGLEEMVRTYPDGIGRLLIIS